MDLEQEKSGTASHRQFHLGLDPTHTYLGVTSGNEDIYSYSGNFSVTPDTWYLLLLAIGKDSVYIVVLRDPLNPDESLRYRRKFEEQTKPTWKFHLNVNKDTILFDDFAEIEFDNILDPDS